MAAIAVPAPRSAATLARRSPTRSTTGPPAIAPSASGSVVANAVRPVRAALPVVTSTNQGNATIAATFPSSEIAFASTSASTRDRGTDGRPDSTGGVFPEAGRAEPALRVYVTRIDPRMSSECGSQRNV